MRLKSNMDTQSKIRKEYTPSNFAVNLPFQACSFSHFVAGEQYYTERSGYNMYLIIYTVAGTGEIVYGNKKYEVHKDDIIFINCNEYQFYNTKKDCNWEFYWLHFNGESVNTYFNIIFKDGFRIIKNIEEVKHIFTKIFAIEINYSQKCELLLSYYISDILTNLSAQENNVNADKILDLLMLSVDYMKKNFSKKVTIDDLCSISGYSRYYYIRIFKSKFGETPHDFLNRYRINISKKILISTDDTIDEISQKVGFNDTNNYITVFKKLTDITPGMYRKYNNSNYN